MDSVSDLFQHSPEVMATKKQLDRAGIRYTENVNGIMIDTVSMFDVIADLVKAAKK